MDNFSELLKNAIAEGDDLESAMRKAAATAAKEAVESLLRTEVQALEKRVVSLFLHYNEGVGRRKVRCWREIVAYYEAK